MAQKSVRPFPWKKLEPHPVIGVDEVGRGCLAGPVCAAAVILNLEVRDPFFRSYTDSKLLSEKRREEMFESIFQFHRVGVGFATVEEINRLNIFHASFLAMRRAIGILKTDTGHVLVDGKFPITQMYLRQTPLIKGDLRARPISAASIVAKVSRDRLMKTMSQEFPQYGFERHKGYGTEEHHERLREFGPCVHHRRYFLGVKEFFEGNLTLPGII